MHHAERIKSVIYRCVHAVSLQTLKVLRTSEFLPYVVFLQSPEFEVLKVINHSAVEAGVVAKTLTVSNLT